MTQVSDAVQSQVEEQTPRREGGFLRTMEIDLRVFGMVLALAVILIGFGIKTNGRFLEPVNLVNLAVQSVSIAILATGMVLIIVSRNIDLSVGSVVGVVAMLYAQLMARVLPDIIGFDHPLMWVIALAAGVALGAAIGGLQGFIIAYIGVPSFVVTLGGLLAFRGSRAALSDSGHADLKSPAKLLLGGAVVAMVALELALVTNDFAISYVANHHASTT